jgi:hypothetical protein
VDDEDDGAVGDTADADLADELDPPRPTSEDLGGDEK